MAYTPRTYLSSPRRVAHQQITTTQKGITAGRTRSLPPRHPALLRIDDRDGPVKVRGRTSLDAIRRAFHLIPELALPRVKRRRSFSNANALLYLHDVFTVGTTATPKVDRSLYDGAEQTCA